MTVAVASVCNKAYAPGFSKMARSLRSVVKDCPPIIQLSPDGFEHPDADETVVVNQYRGFTKSKRYQETFHIFSALDLPYERVVCIDSDMIFLRSPARAWEGASQPFSVCLDDDGLGPRWHGTIERVNSGFMVICPQDVDRELLDSICRSGKSYDGGDQGAVNLYLEQRPDYKILPIRYNLIKRWQIRRPDLLWGWIESGEAIGIHYVGRKPWQGGERGYEKLERIWHEL